MQNEDTEKSNPKNELNRMQFSQRDSLCALSLSLFFYLSVGAVVVQFDLSECVFIVFRRRGTENRAVLTTAFDTL